MRLSRWGETYKWAVLVWPTWSLWKHTGSTLGRDIHFGRFVCRGTPSDSAVEEVEGPPRALPRPAMPSALLSSRFAVYFVVGAGALVVLLATLSLWQLAAGIDGQFARLWLASSPTVRSQPAVLDSPWINVLQGAKQYDDQGNELWNMAGASLQPSCVLAWCPDLSCSCSPADQTVCSRTNTT